MRLALVDPLAYTPPYDDALASALAGRGHDVSLLTGPFVHGEVPPPAGYRREEVFLPISGRLFRSAPRSPLRVPLKALEYWPGTRRLVRRVAALDPAVAHVQWLPRPELDVQWVRGLARERPVVFTAHDVVPRRPRARAAWPQILGAVSRIVVHSQRAAAELEAFGVERERVVVIRHPVFTGGELPPPSGSTLLFFGLIRDYKGLDVLVRALPDVPGARLVVAGDPVDAIDPVRELAHADGVADRVEWRLGYLPDEEVRAAFAESAVVVLPYRQLDSSGVLATAIGYRRPVVVTDVGSLGEIVREFGAGVVVPPDDAEALAEACRRILEPEALAAAVRGADAAARTLTWAAAAAEHEALYESVIRT
jgi:glycosyltransferase involved in cell wall biosynthesis